MAASPGFVPQAPPHRPAPPPVAPPPRVPVWRKIVAATLGVILISAAVYVQTFVLDGSRLDDPLTVSGGIQEAVSTDVFSARLDRVEFAKSVRVKKQFGTDEDTTDKVFLVVKVGATAPRRPIQLTSHLVTADGLRFDVTDHVTDTATLGSKWVQPGWWGSGLFFFEVPPDKVPGARVVVSQKASTIFGDQYLAEASFDLGLDGAKAGQMIQAAKDVYEVSG
ncbi:hypothetical protein GCM10022226_77440 [Sphaerisporangium flaviroseum]|uniref:DUF4352 domain-containing protein n=1 Tax=Sphaerisporangium flaviroseum TaxID=509199 RepID=A0ABP7JFA4_9ACTN